MKMFLSHADADKQLALPFHDLITQGVSGTQVFCSSAKGAIPNGQFFVQNILSELQSSDCTVSLISSNYLKSEFCIAELGSAIVSQFQGKALFSSFTIAPTRFRDLQGMLLGIQSAYIDDVDALNALCSRLGGNSADLQWTNARDAFIAKIKPITDLRKAGELIKEIVVHDFQTDPSKDPSITFKSKIRVQFKNNTGQQVIVSQPTWIAASNDVPLQVPPPNFKVLQLEGSGGWHIGDWGKEADTINVPPGGVFRLWFGLHQAYSTDELRRRRESQQLGVIRFNVVMNGFDLTWERQF